MESIQRIWLSRRCGRCGRKMYKYARRCVDSNGPLSYDFLRCVDSEECDRLGEIRDEEEKASQAKREARYRASDERAIREELAIRAERERKKARIERREE